MDPIYPWLDPVEVKRLADCLIQPELLPSITQAHAGFDTSFVGFTSEAPTAAPPPTWSLPVVGKPTISPLIQESATIAQGPFLDHITRFRDWMRRDFSATDLFILDHDGEVVFDESSHSRLHFLARNLALASRKPKASAGHVHVKISAGATLEIIPVETASGYLILGALVPDSLAPPTIAIIIEALAQVASLPAED